MDTIEIAAKMVRDAVTAMSGKLSTFVKAALDDKQDIATMPTKVSDFTNDSGFQDAQQVEDKIDAKISSAYKAGGSATLATLPALTAAKLGVVVNMSEDFTTTSDFLEGAGKTYPAGTNVVVALADANTYKYDVLAGFVDLSGYVQNTRKVGNVPLSADIPVSLTGDTAITVTNTGTASAIGYSVSHNNSGVTAGSKGDASAQTPAFGGTFKALSATVDAKGHVTSLGDHNVTIPSATATSQNNGLMSSSDKAKLDALSVTASNPLEVTKTGETYNVALKDSGVTAGSKGDATNQAPAFGGTFKALSATVDAKGRLTALSEHTVTVPNAAATQSAAGLMSTADKTKLDAYVSKGGATKGVYIDANGAPQPMTHSLNADVPVNFAPATAAPLMDGAAAVGTSAKYAREDHRHETDTSRASAADVAAIKALLQSAVLYRTASGNPATFSDGRAANFQKLVAAITPTQSGSGDPYPPGGGKNLLPVTLTSGSNNGVSYTVDADSGIIRTSGTSSSNIFISVGSVTLPAGDYILTGCPAEGAVGKWSLRAPATEGVDADIGNGRAFTLAETQTVTVKMCFGGGGNINANGLVFRPMIRRASDTDPTFAPYSNIRPISGVSSVTVTRTGKNLYGGPQSVTRDPRGWYVGDLTLAGACPIFCPNGVLEISFDFALNNVAQTRGACRFFMADGTYLDPPGLISVTTGHCSKSYAVDFTPVAFSLYIEGAGTMSNIQMESGAAPTAYEPYQGQSVTVALVDANSNPLAVYGGTLDVTAGTLTVTHKSVTLNGGENWQGPYNANVAVYNLYIADKLPGYSTSLCDRFANTGDAPVWGSISAPEFSYTDQIGQPKIYMKAANDIMTSAGFKEWLAANPTQLVYALAAPVTYQLTPQSLSALSGYNAVSASAGSVAVEYRADPSLAIDAIESNLTNALLSLGAGF